MRWLTVKRSRRVTAVALALLALPAIVAAPAPGAQPAEAKGAPAADSPRPPAPKVGLLAHEVRAFPGYTLLAPTSSTTTYLIDMQGRVVQSWKSDCNPGLSAYLLDNGHLLRTGQIRNPPFFGGGTGGRLQEFTWDGKLVWDFTYYSDTRLPNHDVCKLPNGNVLMITWEKKCPRDAVAAGRRPATVAKDHLLAGCLLEVRPTGKTTGEVVWEWHAWDHVIQDFDARKANYGNVAAHPERIDLNFGEGILAAVAARPKDLEKLRGIGYLGGPGRGPARVPSDWLHINAVAYNADLDQILLSVHEFSELWIIDHGTTTAEAAGHKGGRHGKGGDLLYRWGNPRAYRAGTTRDRQLFGQHDAQWIGRGLPGQGHVLVFNTGLRRPGAGYSTVEEIVLPVDASGRYEHPPGKAFGPEKPAWRYAAPKKTDFYAPFISGAQRQPNGNTLICSGTNGTVFEVTPQGETVWKYVNPDRGAPPFGAPRFAAPARPGQILPPFLQLALKLTAQQRKELQAAEKEVAAKLDKLLTDKQKKQLQEGGAVGAFPEPGQLLPRSVQDRLQLTAEDRKQLAELQKEADARLDALLKDEQKKQLKAMRNMARAFRGGPPGGFPGAFAAAAGGGLFRAPRYAPDYPGLAGRNLQPGRTVEELQRKGPARQPAGE